MVETPLAKTSVWRSRFRKIRENFCDNFRGPKEAHPFSCLYWARSTGDILYEEGVRFCFQAGSASWWREKDNGRMNSTHFSYMWDEDTVPEIFLAARMLPEMHCWVGLPEEQEIIDITTESLPAVCKQITGLGWDPELRPAGPAVVGAKDCQRLSWLYKPSHEAIKFSLAVLSKHPWG
jgi:hypothetical protein